MRSPASCARTVPIPCRWPRSITCSTARTRCSPGSRRSWAEPAGLLLDFEAAEPYIVRMTKLLDEAVEAVRRLPSADQDDIARAIMQLAGSDLPGPVELSSEEREAISRSKAAADRGEFATDEQVRAVWAKHGL